MGKVLVVGSGVAGVQASLDLADFGHQVFLVERESELGGNLRNLSELFLTGENASDLLANFLREIKHRKNITVMKSSEILDIEGEFPEFKVTVGNSKEKQMVDVNAIILAIGFKPYDPSTLKQYGYGLYKDVITSLELERMLKKGKIVIPSSSKKPNSVSIIQCVGSRNSNTNVYCSAFCCLNAIKLARQIKEAYHETMITICYMDMRTPYLGECDYSDARLRGIRFLRGNPAKVKKDKDTLLVQVEDTLENDLVFIESDVVVLSVGGVPDPSNHFFRDKLNVELSESGFFQVSERPINTNRTGVFVAGAACGLKDTSYSIAQGSCAAAKVDITLRTTS